MKHCKSPELERRGMSLIEMMIALSMFAVVMGVVFGFLTSSRRAYNNTSERAEYQQSVRAVLSLLTREIRSAGCDPEDVGLQRFALADVQQLHVQMDLDGNGDTLGTAPDENVTWSYLVATSELQRDGGTGAQTVLRNVSDVQFRYFDEDGSELVAVPLSATARELVRYVDVAIVGDSGTGEEVHYSTRVLIRND